ncbi:MAG: MBL fold metallo-hydrolase [Patescibacteria group bacterium]|jgi:competence protein ComEC
MTRIEKTIFKFYGALAIGLILLSVFLYIELLPQDLKFYVLNIGQGDAIFIRTPSGYNILIDGGPDNFVVYKLGQYLPFYDRQIDLMILTHPDADHLVGLVEVLRRYQVKAILLTGTMNNSPPYQEFLKIIEDKNPRIVIAGRVKDIGIEPNLDLQILYPFESIADKTLKETNDYSVVAKLNYANFSVLLTGDAPEGIENKLMKAKANIDADVLKIAHHGSSASSGNDFLAGVKPKLAVISVGQNKFGHPSPEVLVRLDEQNIPYFTTLDKGDIIVYSDGQKFWLK